ncbi:glycosyltransferase family 4 protein [Acidisoma sp.]|uniref:glycosyltransferase family 4 protein n=1 Tax=Acidisoma sp. TaxID=1872115 RepID=UPI003B0053D3
MRIAVDMQGALTDGSRRRGIGRYTSHLIEAVAQEPNNHDLRLVLNSRFGDACNETERRFNGLLPKQALSTYAVPDSEGFHTPVTSPRRRIADAIVRRHIAALQPDVLLFSSMFEIAPEDFSPIDFRTYPARVTAAIVYDFIPVVFEELYLQDRRVRQNFFATMDVLKTADLLFAISESARQDAIAWLDVEPDRVVNISAAADDRFRQLPMAEEERRRVQTRFGLTRPFVMYVSGADPRKNLRGAVEAFAALDVGVRRSHQLLLVTSLAGATATEFERFALDLGLEPDSLILARDVTDDDLVRLLNTCRCFIFPSLYEGFGLPILEAMQCGAPVIAAGNSSIPEIVNRSDILFDPTRTASVAQTLQRVLTDESLRQDLASWGLERAKAFTWPKSARLMLDALERHIGAARIAPHVMPCELLDLDGAKTEFVEVLAGAPECDDDLEDFVACLLRSVPSFKSDSQKRLLIDATDTSQSANWTGIQRVVRHLVSSFYELSTVDSLVPLAVRLEVDGPVSIPAFTASVLGHNPITASYPIEIQPGDDLFMLDSNWIRYPEYNRVFDDVKHHGGRVITCVYDLIPEFHPQVCLSGVPEVHERWLRTAIATSNAILCISRAVADELVIYIRRYNVPHMKNLKIGWFHCGSDIRLLGSNRTPGPLALQAFSGDSPTFLSVGTLEPRKNHAVLLDAFDSLWDRGVAADLCVIGRKGWNIEKLESRILNHPQLGKRLHWLADASDDDLVYGYKRATAVICPSIAEGFGLPVVEAARMGCPVICSDIPVFREIGSNGVLYFPPNEPKSLASLLERWLAGDRHANSISVLQSSWSDAAARIHQVLYEDDWYLILE